MAGPSNANNASSSNANASSSSSGGAPLAILDDFVALMLSIPPNEVGSKLLPIIRQLQTKGTAAGLSSIQFFSSPLQDGSDPLYTLAKVAADNKQVLGLGYTHILLGRCCVENQSPADRARMMEHLSYYTGRFNPNELRMQPEIVKVLAEWISYTANVLGEPRLALQPLEQLLRTYSTVLPTRDASTLTPMHGIYAKNCLHTRSYYDALPTLGIPITEIDMISAPVTHRDHLQYHYYGGCIYAACKMWSEAKDMFETAVIIPGTGVSAISLDAYKKWILVQLIHTGKVASLPKYTSTGVQSAFKNLHAFYLDFASLYTTTNVDRPKLLELVTKNEDLLVNDGNYGLAVRCIHRLRAKAIFRLRETYLTVSLQEVAQAFGEGDVSPELLAEAENTILELVSNKELYASISYSAEGASITFAEDPESYMTETTVQQLNNRISQSCSTAWKTQHADSILASSREFLHKALNNSGTFGASGPGPGMMDEDLMYDEADFA